MTQQIKAILFDFNGTMFFDGPKHKEAWNVFSLTYRKKPITDEELDHMNGQTNKKIIELLMGTTLSDAESTQLSKDKEALYRECCRKDPLQFHLVEGLESLLDELSKKHIPMTICSASIKENIDFFIDSFHLDRWFDPSCIIYDDGTHTDKVSMFHDGAHLLQTPIEECLIFEDSYSGISCAHKAGAGSIIVITSPEKEEEYKALPGVDSVIFNYTGFDTSTLK